MVTGWDFEEAAVRRMRERAEQGGQSADDLRLDLLVLITAVEGVLAVHHASKLQYAPGYVCVVDYDRSWPCPSRTAIRQALIGMRNMGTT